MNYLKLLFLNCLLLLASCATPPNAIKAGKIDKTALTRTFAYSDLIEAHTVSVDPLDESNSLEYKRQKVKLGDRTYYLYYQYTLKASVTLTQFPIMDDKELEIRKQFTDNVVVSEKYLTNLRKEFDDEQLLEIVREKVGCFRAVDFSIRDVEYILERVVYSQKRNPETLILQ